MADNTMSRNKQDMTPTGRWLTENGFHVLRFWDHEVLKQLDGVKEAIAQALRAKSV
jgi:very-short-patch-repair endonuclease